MAPPVPPADLPPGPSRIGGVIGPVAAVGLRRTGATGGFVHVLEGSSSKGKLASLSCFLRPTRRARAPQFRRRIDQVPLLLPPAESLTADRFDRPPLLRRVTVCSERLEGRMEFRRAAPKLSRCPRRNFPGADGAGIFPAMHAAELWGGAVLSCSPARQSAGTRISGRTGAGRTRPAPAGPVARRRDAGHQRLRARAAPSGSAPGPAIQRRNQGAATSAMVLPWSSGAEALGERWRWNSPSRALKAAGLRALPSRLDAGRTGPRLPGATMPPN